MKSLMRAAAALAFCIAPAVSLTLGAAPAEAQARHQWRSGDTLPAAVLQGGPNVDYAAQRLRRPPTGYGWFALDGAFLLASLSTGLVLEVVN